MDTPIPLPTHFMESFRTGYQRSCYGCGSLAERPQIAFDERMGLVAVLNKLTDSWRSGIPPDGLSYSVHLRCCGRPRRGGLLARSLSGASPGSGGGSEALLSRAVWLL